MADFSYQEMTTRNIGFVSEAEQEKIRMGRVFICGVGGMGGAAAFALARAGVGEFFLADIDEFEISNLNRQAFCNLDYIGHHKAEAAAAQILKINKDARVKIWKDDWPKKAAALVEQADVVINGTDDLAASLLLYRLARDAQKCVIDAYASPLPSVFVTRPDEPMPEERLKYPTLNTSWNELTEAMRREAFLREAEFVLINSSSRHYVDLELAGAVAAGKRSRMSFAPMVISTGMLMSYEVLNILTKDETQTNCEGWFFNPYKAKVEKPLPKPIQGLLRPVVRKKLMKMMG